MNEEQTKRSFSQVVLGVLKAILKGLKILKAECLDYPFYIIGHPIKGFDEFKTDKRGKLWVALLFAALLIVLNIAFYNYTGFVISQVTVMALNPIREVEIVILLLVVITVANWSVNTFFDGKGKMIEIFKMLCYCLFPLILSKFFNLFISNIVSEKEAAIYTLVNFIGYFFMAYMGLFGFIEINEFGLLKCILNLIFTVLAALVICFFGILAFDLFQKMLGFVYTIYDEISLRYFTIFIGGMFA